MSKYIAYVGKNCVACGACMNICPRQAIQIKNGKKAIVTLLLVWVWFMRETCPAGIIE